MGTLPSIIQSYLMFIYMVSMVTQALSADPIDCIWRSSISATMPDRQEVSVNKECEEGELMWNYPKGYLVTHMGHDTPGRDFRVCLTHNPQLSVSSITHQTTKGNSTMKMPDKGSPSCVLSEKGHVQLEFKAQNNKKQELIVITYYRKPP